MRRAVGATSRNAPPGILDRCKRLAVDPGPLLYASRIAAKVESAVLQDGYQLYDQRPEARGAGCNRPVKLVEELLRGDGPLGKDRGSDRLRARKQARRGRRLQFDDFHRAISHVDQCQHSRTRYCRYHPTLIVRSRRAVLGDAISTTRSGAPQIRSYFTNSISRYVGSGQVSCGVSTSIRSPISRSFAMAGTILSRMYFACFSADALL